MQKKRTAALFATAATLPLLVVGIAGSASAANEPTGATAGQSASPAPNGDPQVALSGWDRTVSWKNKGTGRWLSYGMGKVVTTNDDRAISWWEKKNADGTFTLAFKGFGGGCLDANTKGDVYAIDCNGGNNQKWYETKTSTGWRLKNKATGQILDNTRAGGVYTNPDYGNATQRWS